MEEPPVTSKAIAYIVFGLIFVGFCMLLVYVITGELTSIADIPEGLEEYVLIQRFLSSPDCFTYQDKETSRFYPGIIDLDKFSQENFDKEDNQCYKIEGYTDAPHFRLTIGNEKIQTTDDFNSIKKKEAIRKNILIFIEDKFENANLEIEYEVK